MGVFGPPPLPPVPEGLEVGTPLAPLAGAASGAASGVGAFAVAFGGTAPSATTGAAGIVEAAAARAGRLGGGDSSRLMRTGLLARLLRTGLLESLRPRNGELSGLEARLTRT